MNNPPQVYVWIDIPDDCRMVAVPTFDGEVQFTLGNSSADEAKIVFERAALTRFVRLASDALQVTVPAERRLDPPELRSGWPESPVQVALPSGPSLVR